VRGRRHPTHKKMKISGVVVQEQGF